MKKLLDPGLFNEDKMAQQTPSVRTTHALWCLHGGFPSCWMMPLHYGLQIDEHHAVRTDAGNASTRHI
ncbi:hypothetical protein ACNKHL_17515 [Shigella flexneri]